MSVIVRRKGIALRQTSGRELLLTALRADRAWTARQLHDALPALDLVTIYRNLKTLTNLGLATTIDMRGAERHYEGADRKHHAHHVCDRCQRAACVPCPIRAGDPHHLEFNGLCADCAS